MENRINREEILKQAKKIIDNFHNSLREIEGEIEEAHVERDECEREEEQLSLERNLGKKPEDNSEFRKIMFRNAPKIKDDCIEAEKGAWTK